MLRRISGHTVLQTALLAVTALVPLAVGGAHAPVNGFLAVLLAALLVWAARGVTEQEVRLGPAELAVGLASVLCLVQLAPLPLGLVRLMSPTAASFYDTLPGGASSF